MPKAIWKDALLAESETIAHVEGNAYFPVETVNSNLVRPNPKLPLTFCHRKGFATYFDDVVESAVKIGAAWQYERPYQEASIIKNHIAFWKGVVIMDGPKGRGLVEKIPSKRGDKNGWEALCWLIRHSNKNSLLADDLLNNTGITEEKFEEAWRMADVQRYAKRYRWTLESRSPLVLKRSEGEPIKVH